MTLATSAIYLLEINEKSANSSVFSLSRLWNWLHGRVFRWKGGGGKKRKILLEACERANLGETMTFQQVKQFASGMASDISVLRSIWFKKLDGESHADRLDNFYKNQAEACKRD